MPADFSNLDQKLFGWVFRSIRAWSNPTPRASAEAVSLEALALRLTVLASCVAESPIRIEPTDGVGGVVGRVIRLPATVDLFQSPESNAFAYLARTALDAMSTRFKPSRPPGFDDLAARVAALAWVPSLRRAVCDELPSFGELFERVAMEGLTARAPCGAEASPRARAIDSLVRAVSGAVVTDEGLNGRLGSIADRSPDVALGEAMALAQEFLCLPSRRSEVIVLSPALAGSLLPKPTAVLVEPIGAGAHGGSLPTGSERRARSPEALKRVQLPAEREGENPIEHSFEKVHTAEEYRGGRKAIDGDDELDSHGEALDELDLSEVIRTNEAARSVYRLDGGSALESGDLESTGSAEGTPYFYDEWDGTRYRRRYCRVFEEVPGVRAHSGVTKDRHSEDESARRRVRRVFEALEQARRLRPRMPIGGEVDVDAVIERYGFVRAGAEGPTRLYLDRRPLEPDVATSILLDLSSSSDAWLEGRRVHDIARNAIAILASVMDELHAPFSVAGFYSHSRADCRFVSIKSFDDSWSNARPRLDAVEPKGYTRIGPAIRHATARLEHTLATRRALLLVTDGRPTDYDRYEGRYGVLDVKKACDEASVRGIAVFTLAIATSRQSHLAEMFGPSGYEVLTHPEELADRLSQAQVFFRR